MKEKVEYQIWERERERERRRTHLCRGVCFGQVRVDFALLSRGGERLHRLTAD